MQTSTEELIAKVLIINSSREVLVLKLGIHHTKPESSYKPDLPGGIANAGESGDNAVIRETTEETGILLSQPDLHLAYARTKFYKNENKSVTKHLYISHIASVPIIELSKEHTSFQWMPLDELKVNNIFHGFCNEATDYAITNKLV